jgi:hypothetical protein
MVDPLYSSFSCERALNVLYILGSIQNGSSELPEYLGLIIGCVTAAALVVIVVGIVAVYERRRCYRKSDDRKQLCMSYVSKLYTQTSGLVCNFLFLTDTNE